MKSNATFDVFSGVAREDPSSQKKTLPFDQIDSSASSDEEAPY